MFFINDELDYSKEISTPVPVINLGPRCGYPDVGTIVKTTNGSVKYTKTGLIFSANNFYGSKGEEESED